MNQEQKDIKLFKEVNWLYDRLSHEEMNILMKWVDANCDTVRISTLEEVEKMVNGMVEEVQLAGCENSRDEGFANALYTIQRELTELKQRGDKYESGR